MGINSFLLLFLKVSQLVGVVYVVPDTVEAAGDAGHRVHEGVAEPDGEDGVLLAKTLCCTDGIMIAAADVASEGKLNDAGQEA